MYQLVSNIALLKNTDKEQFYIYTFFPSNISLSSYPCYYTVYCKLFEGENFRGSLIGKHEPFSVN